jgi:hypothetical protein
LLVLHIGTCSNPRRVRERSEERSVMEHTPNMPSINHEEGRQAAALSNESPSVAGKAGAESEEDWLSQATGDPAFWIKEPEVG